MKYIALTILLLQVSTGFAQESYKTFFNKEGVKTSEDSAYYYEVGTKIDGRIVGEIKQYYIKTQSIKSISTYGTNGLQGVRQLYYENGNMRLQESYANHRRTGLYQSWYESGQLKQERDYFEYGEDFDHSIQVNYLLMNCWDSLGNQQVTNGNGYLNQDKKLDFNEENQFDAISEEIYTHIEGLLKNGKRTGKWMGTKGNHSSFEEYYENGVLIKGETTLNDGSKIKYDKTFEQPAPDKGMQTFYKFIAKNLKYPNDARRQGAEGRVYIQFVIDKTGDLIDIKTIKGFHGSCDQEAERVIKKSKAWNAGKLRGIPVKVRFILPLTFTLS